MILFRFGLALLAMLVLLCCSRSAQELSGIVVYGHEVRTVQLCGQPKVYWLQMTVEQQQRLKREQQRLTRQPYQGVYLDFRGETVADSSGEFAKQYDGTIRLEAILNVSATIPSSCSRNQSTD